MDKLIKQMEVIMKELERSISLMNVGECEQILQALYNTKRIFLAGSGRSGLAIRAFANRLLHLGKTVYIVGDITTPSIQAEDILFIGSGSGETAGLIVNAKKAKQSGAKVILNTTNSQSTLGKLADYMLLINVDNKETDTDLMESSIQPMGSAFEQLSLLLYDAIVLEWVATFNETYDDMKLRHANLE
ncbi:6-phospho-3-hexuloisomerase [Paenibacillus sp. LX16]|uniref:6-phospho-3-hexuloisomerase n=1 Tax=Paenibacillus sp. LX16 TaxID=1740264 RepID=UPI002E2D3087|nr:6-phospho-3-hexuloisomerase [Paenibacillus sp. LX16]